MKTIDKIIKALIESPNMTAVHIAGKTGLSIKTVGNEMPGLVRLGKVERKVQGKSFTYAVIGGEVKTQKDELITKSETPEKEKITKEKKPKKEKEPKEKKEEPRYAVGAKVSFNEYRNENVFNGVIVATKERDKGRTWYIVDVQGKKIRKSATSLTKI